MNRKNIWNVWMNECMNVMNENKCMADRIKYMWMNECNWLKK